MLCVERLRLGHCRPLGGQVARDSAHSVGGIPEYGIVRAAVVDAIFAQRQGPVA